jgi:protein TonB
MGRIHDVASSFRLMVLAFTAAAAISSPALAQSSAASDSAACPQPGAANAQTVIITKPKWVKTPDGDDVKDAYPPLALKQQRGDETMMDCSVADDGKLTDCRLLSDKKPGMGFDKAAIKLSKIFRMAPLASIPEYAALPDCIRKAGPPHVLIPMNWNP